MELYSPTDSVKLIKNKIGSTGVAAFFTTLVVGILTHMPALVSEIPNHDGLQSMYFDQNMITSGRFFLGLACGISSYYYIPWLTGILAIFYLSIASILLIKVLNVKNPLIAGLIGALLVTFPVIASDFAY
ncbi:MAG: glucosyltransferase domain-containing protein, partial [Lachnospiraceae bacterium]|nr:glucosyltransferase domain-containing protein [Lachnospiraceae bacterium]